MKLELSHCRGMKICVAVSGGRDSMALLHYLHSCGSEYGIVLSALNCDHAIRGESSARDSAFVIDWCRGRGIPLLFFRRGDDFPVRSESDARRWRMCCYSAALQPSDRWSAFNCKPQIFTADGSWAGADAVAAAHHLDDNAETVLFNLARGTGLAGVTGICDGADGCGPDIIHPLVGCTRGEIDEYVRANGVPYVDDETNFGDDYTRNKIRHNVLPELEKAVPGAKRAIFRFSRIAAEYEEYLTRQAKGLRVSCPPCGEGILRCEERVPFKRAALDILVSNGVKDYTSEHLDRLYELQFSGRGKKFCFLSLTAVNEGDRVVIVPEGICPPKREAAPFSLYESGAREDYFGQSLVIAEESPSLNIAELCARLGRGEELKVLKCDLDRIPATAVIREMERGDRFTKFGGGSKSLGDFFTDRKIPQRVRARVPLVAAGSQILAVCGVEISEEIKVTEATARTGYIISRKI